MARPDSTLVGQVAAMLEDANRPSEVQLGAGDSYVRALVRRLADASGIIVSESSEPATDGAELPPHHVSVPTYVTPAARGLFEFNPTWDRPMVIAQAVGQHLDTWPAGRQLKLGSDWLWFAMRYCGWEDIANLREFIGRSLGLARARDWSLVDWQQVQVEFHTNGDLERLIRVHTDPDFYYLGEQWGGPVHRDRGHPAPPAHPYASETLLSFWAACASSEMAEIACRTRFSEDGIPTDEYDHIPIAARDTLPFLRSLQWWESTFRKADKENMFRESVPDYARARKYCLVRATEDSERKLARAMKMTVKDLRAWRREMRLETEFGGQEDGYQIWLKARDELLNPTRDDVPIEKLGMKRHRLRLELATRTVVVDDKRYLQCPKRAFNALAYALEERQKNATNPYFNRRDLCEHLGIDLSTPMGDIFKKTAFAGEARDHPAVWLSKSCRDDHWSGMRQIPTGGVLESSERGRGRGRPVK